MSKIVELSRRDLSISLLLLPPVSRQPIDVRESYLAGTQRSAMHIKPDGQSVSMRHESARECSFCQVCLFSTLVQRATGSDPNK